jgi:hypothetical protein
MQDVLRVAELEATKNKDVSLCNVVVDDQRHKTLWTQTLKLHYFFNSVTDPVPIWFQIYGGIDNV